MGRIMQRSQRDKAFNILNHLIVNKNRIFKYRAALNYPMADGRYFRQVGQHSCVAFGKGVDKGAEGL